MSQKQMREQEEKVVQFIQNTVPVFKYDKLKVKRLKKYDGGDDYRKNLWMI